MFVGKDVAKALGYKNPNDALSKHVDDEDKGVAKRDTLGGRQKMLLINEKGEEDKLESRIATPSQRRSRINGAFYRTAI